MTQITLGCDPEIMLVDRAGNLKSAIGIFNGGKHDPEPIKGGTILHDNVNAEFGVDPEVSFDKLTSGIGNVLSVLAERANKHDLLLSTRCAADFPASELQDEESKVFGCDPDYDCWKVEENRVPSGAQFRPFRTAGGHIHVGHEELLNFDNKLNIIRMMDATLGVLSIVVDNSKEASSRRNLYGKAGCHRPTDYGAEYRVLSNFWIKSKPICETVLNIAEITVKHFVESGVDLISKLGQSNIVNAINNSDQKAAEKIVLSINVPGYQDLVSKLMGQNMDIQTINAGWSL